MRLRIHFIEHIRYFEILLFVQFDLYHFLCILYFQDFLMLVVFAIFGSDGIKAIREAQRVPRPSIWIHLLIFRRRSKLGLCGRWWIIDVFFIQFRAVIVFLRQFTTIVFNIRWRPFGFTLSLFIMEGIILFIVYEVPLVIIILLLFIHLFAHFITLSMVTSLTFICFLLIRLEGGAVAVISAGPLLHLDDLGNCWFGNWALFMRIRIWTTVVHHKMLGSLMFIPLVRQIVFDVRRSIFEITEMCILTSCYRWQEWVRAIFVLFLFDYWRFLLFVRDVIVWSLDAYLGDRIKTHPVHELIHAWWLFVLLELVEFLLICMRECAVIHEWAFIMTLGNLERWF